MRIAMVAPRYLPHQGGIEAHISQIAEYLVENGDVVDVLTHESDRALPPQERMSGVTVRRFTSVTPLAYAFAPGLWKYLRDAAGRYDIVHAHCYHATAALAASCLTKNRPLVFTPHYHGTGHSMVRARLHSFYRPLGRAVFARADAIVCVSDAEAALVREHFAGTASEIRVIPNGVDIDGLRSAGHIATKHPVVVVLGRVEHYKNIQLVIAALQHLPAVHLVVIGSGPARPALEKLATSLDVGKRVQFSGNLAAPDVRAWLANADLVTCLSSHEAFGIVVVEALTAGTPVLASAIPAHHELARFVQGPGLDFVPVTASPAEVAARVRKMLDGPLSRVTTVGVPRWKDVAETSRRLYSELCESGASLQDNGFD